MNLNCTDRLHSSKILNERIKICLLTNRGGKEEVPVADKNKWQNTIVIFRPIKSVAINTEAYRIPDYET